MNIHVAPMPKNELAMTGEIQWVRLDVHANQNRQICDQSSGSISARELTGKQNAPAKDIGSRASGLTLPCLRKNSSSKYSLLSASGQVVSCSAHLFQRQNPA